MTGLTPSHAWGLALVGFLTARLHPRSGETAWVMMALTTFVLVAVSETVMAAQFAYLYGRDASDVWALHQRVTLCSAILSSLWSPVVSLPLARWWRMMESLGNRP
jgi:rod shape-determining protein MreD